MRRAGMQRSLITAPVSGRAAGCQLCALRCPTAILRPVAELLSHPVLPKGSATSVFCSHPDRTVCTAYRQRYGPSTWEGCGMVFFHCLQLCLQLRLPGALLALLRSCVHPCRLVWSTVKQKGTFCPLNPDVVTVQSPQKQRTSTLCSEK